MPPAESPDRRDDPAAYTAAQLRVIDAAVDLFAERGVGGTSLQMIADRIGVTKAAVYFQFPTKAEIVLAVATSELARVEAVVEVGEAEADPVRAQQLAVDGIVGLAVERRRMESSLVTDPVIVRYFTDDQRFRHVTQRLYRLLIGPETDTDRLLSAAMLTAAIGGAAMHPMVVDLDDDTLRAGLMRLATRFLDPPVTGARPSRRSPGTTRRRSNQDQLRPEAPGRTGHPAP